MSFVFIYFLAFLAYINSFLIYKYFLWRNIPTYLPTYLPFNNSFHGNTLDVLKSNVYYSLIIYRQ